MSTSTTNLFNLSSSLFKLSSYTTFLLSSFFIDYSRLRFAQGVFCSSMAAISNCFFELELSLMIYPSPLSCSLQMKTGTLPFFRLATISYTFSQSCNFVAPSSQQIVNSHSLFRYSLHFLVIASRVNPVAVNVQMTLTYFLLDVMNLILVFIFISSWTYICTFLYYNINTNENTFIQKRGRIGQLVL